MYLRVSYKKKIWKKNYFLASLKSLKKGVDPELDPDPDPLVRDMDLGIRIRTKMSQIPNTAWIRHLWSLVGKGSDLFWHEILYCLGNCLLNSKYVVNYKHTLAPLLEKCRDPICMAGLWASASRPMPPASIISVRYRSMAVPDWGFLFWYRIFSGNDPAFLFILPPDWLAAGQSGSNAQKVQRSLMCAA